MTKHAFDALEAAKRHLRRKIEEDQERHNYVVLWRHYDDGERQWDRYHLMTRASARMVMMSIPMDEPDCKRAKVCSLESEEEVTELGNYPWSRPS